MKEGKKLIVTIGRQYGSGGSEIGASLAKELGIHFYDKNILRMNSDQSGIKESYYYLADEKAGNKLLYKIVKSLTPEKGSPSFGSDLVSADNLFRFQSSVIRELAREESCIIVGRAAGYVLDQEEELERLIRIFVCADKVRRVQRVMEVDAIDEERAKRRIKKMEKSRREYYKYFTGSEWHNMKNYDLTINTTNLDLDQTAELVKDYIRLKGFDK